MKTRATWQNSTNTKKPYGCWFGAGAHTVGFSHCNRFANRIYNFSGQNPVDPTLNKGYATQLQSSCPKNVNPQIAVNMDPTTPRAFDNVYFKNLQQGKGLFSSDQILFTDTTSRPTVNTWASNSAAFQNAFVTAITKLGRVGVKTGNNGNIRRDCSAFNWENNTRKIPSLKATSKYYIGGDTIVEFNL